jgi:hypothetical protein
MQAFHDAETIGDASASVVTFLDNDRFAFGALFSSLPDANAGREFRATIRSNAALAVVDAKSGTIQQVKLWSALKEQSAMFEQLALVPDGSGGMLFALGDRLVRLSPNLEQLAERPLPLNRIERNGYPRQDNWAVLTAPRNDSALLVQFRSDALVENHWISAKTLKDESSGPAPKYSYPGAALLGNSVVFNEIYDYVNDHSDHSVLVQQRGSEPHSLCSSCIGAVLAAFGKNWLFLGTKPAASYIVSDINGNVLHRASHSNEPDFINGASGAADSNRVAFLYGHIPTVHISVFDANAKMEIWDYAMDMQAERVGNIGVSFSSPRIALSPDGHRLVIFANGLLNAFLIQ